MYSRERKPLTPIMLVIIKIVQKVRQLPLTNGMSPDIQSVCGKTAMSSLLRALHMVSHELGVELAPRDYRR